MSRRRREDQLGMAIIAACLLTLAAMLYVAHVIDAQNGISTCQSLANWGMHVC
jgi:hypothetical protein